MKLFNGLWFMKLWPSWNALIINRDKVNRLGKANDNPKQPRHDKTHLT